MRYLEVRRHSKRDPLNPHLSQQGVNLARSVGQQLGDFDQVVTSPLPRCVETAVAMGYAVNKTLASLAGDDGLGTSFPNMGSLDWGLGYRAFSAQLTELPSLTAFVKKQATLWREVVQSVPENGQALLITHGGGFLDGTAVYCLPSENHYGWGLYSDYCDGIRLSFLDGEFTSAKILRAQ